MLLNQICARALKYQAQRRLFSSNINIPLALYNIFNNLERYDDGNLPTMYNIHIYYRLTFDICVMQEENQHKFQLI